ncbi:MAG: quinone-dependent dihydroorotate dehydrogenase [Bacteroidales bacterium]|nr:quinone-dependent dihydroorotate dehydrogenase [Bacteroidales bacterium]
MYKKFIRPILFLFSPESAHKIIFGLLKFARHIPGLGAIIRLIYKRKSPSLEKELFGLKFPNPVGIAGGLDKNGEFYNDLSNFGFGFVEIGSLTPDPQDGNPQPRCFRLPKDKAIINRMGINNKGVRYAIDQLRKEHPKIIVAANITKNSKTPNELAYKDYERSVSLLYDFVDFFVLNISCPNVKNLTELQDITMLSEIIDRVMTVRRYNEDVRPILLKVSPDIPKEQLDEIINLCLTCGIDGIVATNTTRSREGLSSPKAVVDKIGNGGLSGAPLFVRSLEFVQYIHQKSDGLLPIIAVGGIMTPQQARQMLDAGASLIEVYSGFIYNGPSFAKQIIKHLQK